MDDHRIESIEKKLDKILDKLEKVMIKTEVQDVNIKGFSTQFKYIYGAIVSIIVTTVALFIKSTF